MPPSNEKPDMKSSLAQPVELAQDAQLVEQAWIGDAVLTLYARTKILLEDRMVDGAKCARLTSNHFLAAIGQPTKVEAEVGRVYARGGLMEAFAWIEAHIVPLFEKQEINRSKKSAKRKRIIR